MSFLRQIFFSLPVVRVGNLLVFTVVDAYVSNPIRARGNLSVWNQGPAQWAFKIVTTKGSVARPRGAEEGFGFPEVKQLKLTIFGRIFLFAIFSAKISRFCLRTFEILNTAPAKIQLEIQTNKKYAFIEVRSRASRTWRIYQNVGIKSMEANNF